MHYRNGREAKLGDKVVGRDCSGNPIAGMLVSAVGGTSSCNGQLVSLQAPTYYVTIGELLHVDDALPKT